MSPEIRRVLERLDAVKPSSGGWIARCPAHADGRPSLKIDLGDDGRVLLKCYAGCEAEAIVRGIDLELADLFPPRENERRARGRRVERTMYDVRNEGGTIIGTHVRDVYESGEKHVWWKRPTGESGLGGVPLEKLPLYGVHEIARAAGIVVTEGERAREALHACKVAAVGTVTGSSSAPGPDALRPLVGKLVVLWPDRDAAGERHMSDVARRLAELGQPPERIRRVCWPDAPPTGDAADWVGERDDLLALIQGAEPWPFSANGTHDPDGADAGDDELPRFNAGRDDFAALTPLCWAAIEKANDPPRMFLFDSNPIRLDQDEAGRRVPRTLGQPRLSHELTRAARWYKTVKVGSERVEVASSPKKPLVEDMLMSPSLPLPPLDRIVSAPVFGPDGSLQTERGYHAASRTYYDGELALRTIPDRPSDREVNEALDWLLAELLVDFPFKTASDSTHAIGELLLPFVRTMIAGTTPLHVHEAPAQGTGKDLLAESMCLVVTGVDPKRLHYSEQTEEFGKRLLAMLRTMPEWVVVPNVSGKVNNDYLTDTISNGWFSNRLLGVSETLTLPSRNVWTLTSNNAQLNADMVRRAVRIRMDAEMERPELRTAFRHRPLKPWVITHRSELVWSCLILVRSWIAAGMPPGTETLGGFENWTRVVGGIVAHIGCDGFLANREEFIAQADTAGDDERAFVALWWEQRGPAPSGVSDLYRIATDEDVNLDITAQTDRGSRVRLGARLRQMRDRRYRVADGRIVVVIAMGTAQRAALWKLSEESPPEVHSKDSLD